MPVLLGPALISFTSALSSLVISEKHIRILSCYSTVFVFQPFPSAPPQCFFLFYLVWAVVLNITLDCVFLACALSGFVCPLDCFLPLHADGLLFTKNYRAALTMPSVSAPGLPLPCVVDSAATLCKVKIHLELPLLCHSLIKAAFRAISVVVTGQQVFAEMMTRQERANIVLTSLNSWSGVRHLCACTGSLWYKLQSGFDCWNKAARANANSTCHKSPGFPGRDENAWILEGRINLKNSNSVHNHPSSSFTHCSGIALNQQHLSYLEFVASTHRWIEMVRIQEKRR